MNSETLMRKLLPRALPAVVLLSSLPLVAAERMTPGKWEFTMTNSGTTRTFTRCVGAEEAASVNGDSKAGRAFLESHGPGCKIKSYTIKADTITVVTVCGDVAVTSTSHYHGTSAETQTVTKISDGRVITNDMHGHRVGSCR